MRSSPPSAPGASLPSARASGVDATLERSRLQTKAPEQDGFNPTLSRPECRPTDTLETAVNQALACRLCEAVLPLGPRPILRVSETARILLISQAPGTAAHRSGVPWSDASGDRLRGWLLMDRDLFYDATRIAILPTGLCYPGRLPKGGDAPPRPECAPLWLDRFIPLLPQARLTLLIGSHAMRHRLGKGTMTERVRQFRDLGPTMMALPHPSWRTAVWEKRNPWFNTDVLPALRQAVAAALT
jgi:uracil-DNA glycosylase